jgi:hypothetical protein
MFFQFVAKSRRGELINGNNIEKIKLIFIKKQPRGPSTRVTGRQPNIIRITL